MTSNELKRKPRKAGCAFQTGKGGHLIVRRGNRKTHLPAHGSRKELPTGTVQAILGALGLKGKI